MKARDITKNNTRVYRNKCYNNALFIRRMILKPVSLSPFVVFSILNKKNICFAFVLIEGPAPEIPQSPY